MVRLRELSLVLVAACSWLPADHPTAAAPQTDAAAFAHEWHIDGHVLTKRPLISDADAAMWDGHAITISATGYQTPWQGTCEEAGRQKHARAVADVAAALEFPREAAHDIGLADPLTEYRFTCSAQRTPALVLYVSRTRAMTCWSGVCYWLAR